MSTQKPTVIKLGSASAVPVVEEIPHVIPKIVAAGVNLSRDANGDYSLLVTFPGVKRLSLTREDIGMIATRLTQVPVEGSSAGAVFTRTGTEDEAGNFTARFSDVERSRSVTVRADEREALASFLADTLVAMDETIAKLESGELKPDAE